MVRKIKFRAWAPSVFKTMQYSDKQQTIYPDPFDNDSFWIGYYKLRWTMIGYTGIIMQCTELKDIEGVEIWEGDILKVTCPNAEINGKIISVIFQNGAFRDSYYGWTLHIKSSCYKVIGNIHENLELIKEEK